MVKPTAPGTAPRGGAGSSSMRIFAGLARAWSLSHEEARSLLGLASVAELQKTMEAKQEALPREILERFALLLDIFEAINTLLPIPEQADAWVRKPNEGPPFGGRSALSVMKDLAGLRIVRQYLQAQIWAT